MLSVGAGPLHIIPLHSRGLSTEYKAGSPLFTVFYHFSSPPVSQIPIPLLHSPFPELPYSCPSLHAFFFLHSPYLCPPSPLSLNSFHPLTFPPSSLLLSLFCIPLYLILLACQCTSVWESSAWPGQRCSRHHSPASCQQGAGHREGGGGGGRQPAGPKGEDETALQVKEDHAHWKEA